IEDAANFLLRESAEWRMTAPRARQRQLGRKTGGEHGRVDAHLRHLPIHRGAGKEGPFTGLDENVQHSSVKGRVGRVPVRFPVLVGEIEFDAPAKNLSAIDPDGGVGKIRSGFAIPSTGLHNLDLLAGRTGERFPKVSREPARLQLELAEVAWLREEGEGALANF